ncbi:MAG: hypothetical protein A2W09_05495 [Deltaproteobacteria bacterium RBG_16_50_11]|nr:MAG: hypothetical protein A2W09_05495 [Deltaproteobacteria bacterium RBG_16_50_11]
MIAFDLICSNGHLFECWFKDSASYEDQKSAGVINCPICDDVQVERVYSPFMIKRSDDKKRGEVDAYQASRLIETYLEKHFEDVGGEFYTEAIKMHYGESKKRNIKGTTTTEEEVILKEEGVPFVKIPIVKRLLN